MLASIEGTCVFTPQQIKKRIVHISTAFLCIDLSVVTSVVTKHLKKRFEIDELQGNSVCAFFAHTEEKLGEFGDKVQ